MFDRDYQSNTDVLFINKMISTLGNARDNGGYDRQGLLLLSYPAIESFTLSNFEHHVFRENKETGKELKQYLHSRHINHQNITEESLMCAVRELWEALQKIGKLKLDLDSVAGQNTEYKKEFDQYFAEQKEEVERMIAELEAQGYLLLSTARQVKYATLTAAGWSQEAPYQQTVSVPGILAIDTPVIKEFIPGDSDAQKEKAIKKAAGMEVLRGGSLGSKLTLARRN